MALALILFYVYFATLHLSVAGMEIALWLVFLPTLFNAIKEKKFIWPSKILLTGFAGLLTVAIISFCINIQKPDEFLEYVGEFRWMMNYIIFMQFFNLYFSRINFSRLILVDQIVLIFAGFYSIYQFFTAHDPFRSNVLFHYLYVGSPYFRPNSFFGLPTTYAYASAMFFCVSLAFWMREQKSESTLVKNIRRFYFLMSPFNIFLTFTRAAWIAFISSTLVVLRLTSKKFFIRVTIVFVLFIIAFYSSFPSFRNRINSMADPTYNANENRIYLWKANLDIFEENPFFGLGYDQNRKQIDTYLDRYNKPEIMRNHPHNTYLNYLAGLGFFGLAFFVLILGYHLFICIRGIYTTTNSQHKTLFIGSLGLQLVLLIGGLTECTFEDSELTHQYILFTSLVEYLRARFSTPDIPA